MYDPNFKVVPDRNLTHVQCSCVLIVLRFNFVEILVEECVCGGMVQNALGA